MRKQPMDRLVEGAIAARYSKSPEAPVNPGLGEGCGMERRFRENHFVRNAQRLEATLSDRPAFARLSAARAGIYDDIPRCFHLFQWLKIEFFPETVYGSRAYSQPPCIPL